MEHKRVFVVGYMGVGKSTSGSRLARLMDLPFLDTDASCAGVRTAASMPSLTSLAKTIPALERDLLRELVAAPRCRFHRRRRRAMGTTWPS